MKENFLSRQIFKVILSFSLDYAKLKPETKLWFDNGGLGLRLLVTESLSQDLKTLTSANMFDSNS